MFQQISLIYLLAILASPMSCLWNGGDDVAQHERYARQQLREFGVQRNFIHSLKKESAVVIEGYFLKPAGSLHYISKGEGGWYIKQTIDLASIMGNFSPRAVVHNENWICLQAIPLVPGNPGKLFIFQMKDETWKLVDYPEAITRKYFTSDISLDDKRNHLIFTERSDKEDMTGCISIYDLNQDTIPRLQTIRPHYKRIDHASSGYQFAYRYVLDGDTLVCIDKGALFSVDEFKEYGLTVYDLPMGGHNILYRSKGKVPPIETYHDGVERQAILHYQFEDGAWKFKRDIFYDLPHPTGGILRENRILTSDNGTQYRRPLDVVNFFALHGNTIWLEAQYVLKRENSDGLYLESEIFVLQRDQSGQWLFKERFQLPKDLNYTTLSQTLDVAPKYSSSYKDNCIEVVHTDALANWTGLWSLPFCNQESYDSSRKLKLGVGFMMNPEIKSSICDKTILLSYRFAEAYIPNGKLKDIPAWSGLSIYEIDDATGIHEVFRMEANDNKNLDVVSINDYPRPRNTQP